MWTSKGILRMHAGFIEDTSTEKASSHFFQSIKGYVFTSFCVFATTYTRMIRRNLEVVGIFTSSWSFSSFDGIYAMCFFGLIFGLMEQQY